MSRKRTLNEFVSCVGKVKLDMRRAFSITKKQKRSAYKCKFCGNWHVGSVPVVKEPDKRKMYVELDDDCEFN